MCRNTVQIAKLIDPHPERNAHFGVEFDAASRKMLDQEIKLSLKSQAPEHDRLSQRQIAFAARFLAQKIGRESSLVDTLQNSKRDVAGRTYFLCHR